MLMLNILDFQEDRIKCASKFHRFQGSESFKSHVKNISRTKTWQCCITLFFLVFLEPPPIPSLCMTPMDRGLCRAKETRFFYNYSTGRCRPFTYSGCGGNENNFTSRKSCLRICRKGMGTDIATDYHKRQVSCMLWAEIFLQFLVVSIGLIECNSWKYWQSTTGNQKRELEREGWTIKYCVQEQDD